MTEIDEALIREADEKGMSVEELAELREREMDERGEVPEEAKEVPPTQLALPGTRDRLTDKMGGGTPEESELRVVGARRPIVGQFDIGESVSLLVGAKITEAGIVTPTDEWGTVQRRVRVHKARQLHVRHATREALVRELIAQGAERAEVMALYDEMRGD